MNELTSEYLTTRELAELLRIKERKVYDLAAAGDIPCTRALGKLLFRRTSIDAWLTRHASGETETPTVFPTVFLGSHDPLLEWALRESDAGIATYFDGSLDGVARFGAGEGIATGLHIYDRKTDAWNTPLVGERFAARPAVLTEWAWRERGLVLAPGNPGKVGAIADLKGRRVVPRQAQAGSQILLEHLLGEAGLSAGDIDLVHAARSETDAALAVAEGQADAAFGLHSVADQYRLDFVPIVRERFDLLVWRSEWFEVPFQKLLQITRTTTFSDKANSLAGYDISGLGTVHFNGR